jgi:hypothetical protein
MPSGKISRRAMLAYLGSTILAPCVSEAQTLSKSDWQNILDTATRFVAHESQPNSQPFLIPSRAELIASDHKVFFHYFPPFPLSFKNEPRGKDYYDDNYLQRSGEGGKFAKVGGYLRERPLAAGPWSSPYWRQINFAIEILRARATGADGFMVDMLRLRGDPSWSQIQTLFDTAAAVAPDFHIAPEPDAAALKSITSDRLVESLLELSRGPSAYRLSDGRVLVVAFAPEKYPPSFWRSVIEQMSSRKAPIAFMPVFLNPMRNATDFMPFSYGLSYWGAKDIGSVESGADDSVRRQLSVFSRIFMLPITPQDSRPKVASFSESNNTLLFRDLWMQAIKNEVQFVQMITWNDYSESTEISPSSGIQFVFYDLATYFTAWFKTGSSPKITHDAVFYTHRRQLLTPDQIHHNGDTAFRVVGPTPAKNSIEMLAFLTQPASIEIEISGQRFKKSAPTGLSALQAPAVPGWPVFRIVRNGQVALEKRSDWEILSNPDRDDPLYVGGSSTRSFCANARC